MSLLNSYPRRSPAGTVLLESSHSEHFESCPSMNAISQCGKSFHSARAKSEARVCPVIYDGTFNPLNCPGPAGGSNDAITVVERDSEDRVQGF